MAKPEWGTKRICQSCGTRYYDFNRDPIICPACGATFEAESTKGRRRTARNAVAEETEAPAKDEVAELEVETEESDALEDADELGDDADMEDVVVEGDDNEDEQNT